MNLRSLLASSVLFGLLVAIVWVIFWAHFVPELTGTEVWSGHEPLTAAIFLIAWIVSLVAILVSNRR